MHHKEYNGKTALVYFRGCTTDGIEIENHTEGEPEHIFFGGNEIPRGALEALYDMEIGEERTVIIPCEKAYGPHSDDGIQRYARSFIRNGYALTEGTIFAWTHPVSGELVPVKCIEATPDTVTIDFNHLLAGKDLEYWFQLIDVVEE